MNKTLSLSQIAKIGANNIKDNYLDYVSNFKAITRRARLRFENREWHDGQADAVERLELYRKKVAKTIIEINTLLGERGQDKLIWASMKAVYSTLITDLEDRELAETFYNSITRRIFTTIGVDPQTEFVDTDFESLPSKEESNLVHNYINSNTLETLVADIL